MTWRRRTTRTSSCPRSMPLWRKHERVRLCLRPGSRVRIRAMRVGRSGRTSSSVRVTPRLSFERMAIVTDARWAGPAVKVFSVPAARSGAPPSPLRRARGREAVGGRGRLIKSPPGRCCLSEYMSRSSVEPDLCRTGAWWSCRWGRGLGRDRLPRRGAALVQAELVPVRVAHYGPRSFFGLIVAEPTTVAPSSKSPGPLPRRDHRRADQGEPGSLHASVRGLG